MGRLAVLRAAVRSAGRVTSVPLNSRLAPVLFSRRFSAPVVVGQPTAKSGVWVCVYVCVWYRTERVLGHLVYACVCVCMRVKGCGWVGVFHVFVRTCACTLCMRV